MQIMQGLDVITVASAYSGIRALSAAMPTITNKTLALVSPATLIVGGLVFTLASFANSLPGLGTACPLGCLGTEPTRSVGPRRIRRGRPLPEMD
jgi:hypothetical protein